MVGQNKRDGQRVPVALRIKLRFRKVDSFVSKFATNISTHGMFISSREPKEPGTQLRFELRLADDSTAISGRGLVTWVRAFDPDNPKEPHGMGIEFVGLSKDSKVLIDRMVSVRVEQGLGDEGIPFAVNDASATSDADAPMPSGAQSGASAPGRRSIGGDESAKVSSVFSVEDVISSKIDMRSALHRARVLAGSEAPDSELAKLSRVSAAPVAETVDLASHELAQILGGAAIVARSPVLMDPPTDYAGLTDALDGALEPAVAETRDSTGEGIPDDSRDDLPPIVSDDLLPIVEDDLSPLVSNDRPNDPLSADETVLIADQDDQFEMFEETAVGAEGVAAEQEIPAVDDDPPTPFLPLLENDAPMGRAETYVQELDSYDDLAAEREFASAAVPHAAAPVQADPLEDLLGQLEDEVAVATEAPDELPVLAELEALQEQESAIKAPRLETAEIDELEILEEFGEEASVDVVRSEVPAGLDSALASFGDASVDIDDESDFEIDVTDSV